MNAEQALQLSGAIKAEYTRPEPDMNWIAEQGIKLAIFITSLNEDECKTLLNRIRGD